MLRRRLRKRADRDEENQAAASMPAPTDSYQNGAPPPLTVTNHGRPTSMYILRTAVDHAVDVS
jgi:hypothetical protein